MRREFLRAKIHRATVTGTEIDYEGSLTLDRRLMDVVGLAPFEKIDVYSLANGARFSTYLIPGDPGSGVVCLNGAAALLASPGDRVIIAAYASLEEHEIAGHEPLIVLVDDRNRIVTRVPVVSTGS